MGNKLTYYHNLLINGGIKAMPTYPLKALEGEIAQIFDNLDEALAHLRIAIETHLGSQLLSYTFKKSSRLGKYGIETEINPELYHHWLDFNNQFSFLCKKVSADLLLSVEDCSFQPKSKANTKAEELRFNAYNMTFQSLAQDVLKAKLEEGEFTPSQSEIMILLEPMRPTSALHTMEGIPKNKSFLYIYDSILMLNSFIKSTLPSFKTIIPS